MLPSAAFESSDCDARVAVTTKTLSVRPPTKNFSDERPTTQDLFETQELMIASLRTQLAAMTSVLQQGVRVPVGEAPPAARNVHVRFDNGWKWTYE